jgi:hypothetical protein
MPLTFENFCQVTDVTSLSPESKERLEELSSDRGGGGEGGGEVEFVNLEHVMRRLGHREIHVVKMDIEGILKSPPLGLYSKRKGLYLLCLVKWRSWILKVF